jgi:putative restriction endonuclease
LRYWWVNQKQTHRHEIGGGYLWSPKRKRDHSRNQFYENMKAVAPGDLVFSYWESAIRAYGTICSFGYDAPKPVEFGLAGRNWGEVGYRVDVQYVRLEQPISPRDHWGSIGNLLPEMYSPLNRASGRGLQSVYLAELPLALGQVLWSLSAQAGNPILVRDRKQALMLSAEEPERELWEGHIIEELAAGPIPETEREALVKARRGQGLFRSNISRIERECRITGVTNPAYLIASHIKPWRHASNGERLNRHNGLMLAPQADFLFDRGFITFSEGRVLVSPVADEAALVKLGVDPDHPPGVGSFTPEQETFLDFHRSEIFRTSSAA